MLQKQSGYRVGDQWFATRAEASEHIAREQLTAMLQHLEVESAGFNMADWLVANREHVISILSSVRKRPGRGPRQQEEQQEAAQQEAAQQETA
jgi:hypothetical protein